MLNNVPQVTQSLGQTQAAINTNFSTIDTAFSINHVQYNDGSGNQGKHKLVDFPVQPSAPSLASGDDGLYNLLSTLTSLNELFVHKQTFAGTADIPFTASTLSTSTPTALSSGWTYLPSGFILKWGTGVGTGLQVVPFPTGANIPVYTTHIITVPFIANGGGGDVNQAIRLTAVGPAGFTAYCSPRTTTGSATVDYGYISIGF